VRAAGDDKKKEDSMKTPFIGFTPTRKLLYRIPGSIAFSSADEPAVIDALRGICSNDLFSDLYGLFSLL
jgi:hypothetical protein